MANELRGRVDSVPCLRAADAVYHRNCYRKFYKPVVEKAEKGLTDEQVAFEKVVDYLEEHGTRENIISLKDLRSVMSLHCTQPYTSKWLKTKLLQRFKDELIICNKYGQEDIVLFHESATKLLANFHTNSFKDEEEQKIKHIKLAAKLLVNDVIEMDYSRDTYFSIDSLTAEEQLKLIPDSLKTLLRSFIPKRSKVDRSAAVAFIGQALMHLICPSYTPPLHVAVGAEVHSYGSAYLVNLLHSLGVSVSAKGVRDFERCCAVTPSLCAVLGSEMTTAPLFSADNVDVQKVTLTGHGTFHGMGMIMSHIQSRESSVSRVNHSITKRKVTKSEIVSNVIAVKKYPNSKERTINDLELLGLEGIIREISNPIPTSGLIDYLRVASLTRRTPAIAGVMHIITKGNKIPGIHTVEFLPIIDLPSKDWNCMFTTLDFIMTQHMKLKLPGTPILGFDQPLWKTAMIIKKNMDLKITILLGNFHTQTSFLGAMGYIMKNSGLEEALHTVYSEEPVKKILQGKYYERAVRAHSLVSTVLKSMLLEQVEDHDRYAIEAASAYFQALLDENTTPLDLKALITAPVVTELMRVIQRVCDRLCSSGTNRLFSTYLEMYDVFIRNLHAERMGNWEEYLTSCTHMLPYLAASGRREYTKCLTWFIQEMSEGLDEWTRSVFLEGQWVVRRTPNPYAGVSVDLAIEQSLMATLKGNKGLMHSRGFTELNYLVWALSRPMITQLSMQLKQMVNLNQEASLNVKHLSEARLKRDHDHMELIKNFFTERCLFSVENKSDLIMNIATGVIAPKDVNVHQACDVGLAILESMKQENPLSFKITKKSLAIQIPRMSIVRSLNADANKLEVDPELLFQRALHFASSEETTISLEECLSYELAEFSPSLFHPNGYMRSCNKADLATYLLKECKTDHSIPPNAKIVLDGGALLHRVGWKKGDTFDQIINVYHSFINSQFKSTVHIVFDGYLESSTKDHIHQKRQPISSLPVEVSPEKKLLCKKQVFLSNAQNKQSFVDSLAESLSTAGHTVIKSRGDADLDIVLHAIEQSDNTVVLVGDDTDLLVLLLHYEFQNDNADRELLFYRPSSNSCVNIKQVLEKVPERIISTLLFIHAASGCDTVSALAGIGKTRLVKMMSKDEGGLIGKEFYDEDADMEQLKTIGAEIIACLYHPNGLGPRETLEDLRIRIYRRKLAGKRAIQLKVLPPTRAAADQHTMRIFLQVQNWLGRSPDAEYYGWKRMENELIPVQGYDDICPDTIKKILACKCKKGCVGNKCSCKKHGLHCTDVCTCSDCENRQEDEEMDGSEHGDSDESEAEEG